MGREAHATAGQEASATSSHYRAQVSLVQNRRKVALFVSFQDTRLPIPHYKV